MLSKLNIINLAMMAVLLLAMLSVDEAGAQTEATKLLTAPDALTVSYTF